MNYQFLEPIKVGNLQLKNRIMYLAMVKYLSTAEHFVTDRQIYYYESIAKGGVGLIVPGAMIIDGDWPSVFPNQPGLYNDRFIPGLTELTEKVHDAGSRIFFQLWHPGTVPYGCKADDLKTVTNLTHQEIHVIEKKYAEAALRAKKAGADGVEFHLAHNYLPEEFFVPLFNQRTDEYSAETVENGLRFSLEAIAQIQKLCGSEFPISVKINGDDFVSGGATAERAAEAGVFLEKAGVCLISVNAGGSLTRITGMSGDGYCEEGWKVPLAESVKKRVTIPVCACGSLRHPQFLERILRENKCDMIGMGRGIFADFEWVNKVKGGKEEEIAYCVNCMHCFNPVGPGEGACSLNPLALEERGATNLDQNGEGHLVCVVGSGPAGMQAAFTLRDRGFKVIVLEADKDVGGMVRLAAVPNGKAKFHWISSYYKNKAKAMEIEIRLNTVATSALLRQLNPKAVILATGSRPFPLNIPGIDLPHVHQVRDVLEKFPALFGKKVLVVGSGATGLETAVTFSHNNNAVTVMDMIPAIPTNRDISFIMPHINKAGLKLEMGYKLLEITCSKVIAENAFTKEKKYFDADYVVLSLGVKPNDSLYQELHEEFNVFCAGDCLEIGKIADAIKAGFHCARQLT